MTLIVATSTSAPPDGALAFPVEGLRAGRAFATDDWIAEEVPVALEYNGISHAVMLATPLDLHDFALGFSLAEGLIDRPGELYGVDEDERSALGITLRLEIAGAAFARLKDRRRNLAGRTGCGLCGTESLAQVLRPLPELPRFSAGMGARIAGHAIAAGLGELADRQALQKATGATHAAAWCCREGRVRWLREDVGRHNALDKLTGALARAGVNAATGFIAITSRASFEMVQKTALAGVPLLAAVSAPTSLAVTTAASAGLTLIGFARQDDLVVYSGRERVALGPPL